MRAPDRRRGRTSRARGVVALLAFVATTVAVPVGLAAVSRSRFGAANPLHGVPPPWDWELDALRRTFTDRLGDGVVVDVILRASLVACWAALAVIVVTTIAELIHLVRHDGIALPRVRGIALVQPGARMVALALLSLVPPSPSRSAVAAPHAVMVLDESVAMPSVSTPSAIAPTAPRTERLEGQPAGDAVHTVARGESVWSIASQLADGDERRTWEITDAILDRNLGATMADGQRFTNPAHVQVGWQLVIPAASAPTSDPPADDHRSSGYVVRAGDTLWDIADEQLGDPHDWSHIWELNAGRAMADGETFDQPDLIVPGWELELPTDEAPPDAVPTHPTDPGPAVPGTDEPTPATTTTSTVAPAPRPNVPGTDGPSATSTTSEPARPNVPGTDGHIEQGVAATSTTTTSTIVPAGAAGDGEVQRGEAPIRPPAPLRLEHAALLAAGVLTLVAVRRRRRLRQAWSRSRIPPPAPDVAATERRLRATDVGERSARVDIAIRAAASALVDTDAQIGVLLVDRDGALDVHLSAPAELPPPWEGAGTIWRLPANLPIELLGEPARRVGAPCSAVVHLGATDDGRDVLVDLEACGTLAVAATPELAVPVVTAIAANVAASMYAETAHLVGVGLPDGTLLGHRNAHTVGSVDAAFDLAASLVGSTMTRPRSTFSLRSLHTGGEAWEPAVVLIAEPDGAAELVQARPRPAPGHGLAVVLPVPEGSTLEGATLSGDTDRGWRLAAFGLELSVRPLGLDAHDVAALGEVLASADASPERSDVGEESVVGAPDLDPVTPAPEFVPMPHEIVVRLLGGVEVTDRAGHAARFERSKAVELIAWLATHRERATRSGARTALWELDVRDATFANVVSEARRTMARLVPPPDGDEEWLARTLTDRLPLHEQVVTDAQLVAERVDRARLEPPSRAIEILRPAVELIRDVPFAGTSYLWPDAEGITSELVLLATTAAGELAAHALSLGDTELVFRATGQGLKVLPGHEELVGLRMRAHARAGDLAGVRHEWECYERVIVSDAWSDGESSPKLLELRRELLTPSS